MQRCWQRVRWQVRWGPSPSGTAGTEWSRPESRQGMERARSSGWGGGGRREGRRGTVPGYRCFPAPLGYCCCCWRSPQRQWPSPGQPPRWGGRRWSRKDPGTEEKTSSEYLQSSLEHLMRADVQQVANVNVSFSKRKSFHLHVRNAQLCCEILLYNKKLTMQHISQDFIRWQRLKD